MKYFGICAVVLLSFSLNAMENSSLVGTSANSDAIIENNDGLVQEIAPGVYTGQAKVGNEVVYFGMEKIDEKNYDNWLNYVYFTLEMSHPMAGIISQIAKNPQLPFDENIKKLSGFSSVEEYNRYVKKVSKFAKNKDISKLFFGIRGASNGLQLNPDGNNYFVYASRKPVNGRFQFPNFTREPITLTEYYSYFGDILMVVTSRDEVGTDHYRNRGIF